MVIKIIADGQADVGRAALDWARSRGVRHGGYSPKSRHAESGRIPQEYRLTELSADSCPGPGERNVIESDGTLIITTGSAFAEEAAITAEYCRQHGKPLLQLKGFQSEGSTQFTRFLEEHQIYVLNITGSFAPCNSGMDLVVHSMLEGSSDAFLFPGHIHPQNAKHCQRGLEAFADINEESAKAATYEYKDEKVL